MNTQKTVTDSNGLIHEFSPVLAEKIITKEESKARGITNPRLRVQLRQEVKTTYPAARGNELFNASEFGLGAGQSFVEKRVAWLNVPDVKVSATATPEEVGAAHAALLKDIEKRLGQMQQPKLVRILSLKPILSADQERTIDNGVNPLSYEDYVNRPVLDGNKNIVKYRGLSQYRKTVFAKSWCEDEDYRAMEFAEMSAEAGALQIAAGKAKAGVRI